MVVALDVVCPREQFQSVVMAFQGKVAPGKRSEDIGVIDLGIFDIAHFGNLSRGDSQMVDSLVEALGLKIGLSNGKVRRDQSEV